MARTYGMQRLKEGLEAGIVALGSGIARNVVGTRSAASVAAGRGAPASAVEAQEAAIIKQPTPPGLLWLDGIGFGVGVLAEVAGVLFGMPALGELGEGAWIPATAYGAEDLTMAVRRRLLARQTSGTTTATGASSSRVRVLEVRRGGGSAPSGGAGGGYGAYDAAFETS